MDLGNGVNKEQRLQRTKSEAEEAVRVLLEYLGEDPSRDGLSETPERVVRAWSEYCAGYSSDPATILKKTFENPEKYSEPVVLRDISFVSHCEHHLAPINGFVDVAYVPSERIVGISKIARVVECFSRRLQTQETMTAQIANILDKVLQPKGVAVVIDAGHQCMSTRGIHKTESSTITSRMLGIFRDKPETRAEFMHLIHSPKKF